MVCLRELAVELDAIPLDLSQQLSLEQLRDELMALEFQRLVKETGKSPLSLISWQQNPELDYHSDEAQWMVYIPTTSEEYFWVSRSQLISYFHLIQF